jgi:integrase
MRSQAFDPTRQEQHPGAKEQKPPLTDVAIRALRPRKNRYFVRDPGAPGLWLEIFPSGTKAWRYRYHLFGNAEKVAIGKYPDMSLKAARKRRNELATMVAEGKSPAKEKQQKKMAVVGAVTMRQFSEIFFKDMASRNVQDTSAIRRYLDKQIYPAFGDKPIDEVTVQDVRGVIFRKKDNGFPSAAAQIRNLIKRIFVYANVRGLTIKNPALAIPTEFITSAESRDRALHSEEITVFIQTVYRSNIRRQFKLAFHIILLTLIRKSELLLAEWSELKESGVWIVPAEHTKGRRGKRRPHVIYLASQVAKLFEELRILAGNSRFILPGRSNLSKPFAKNALNQALAGITFPFPKFTIHDLRRTASTLLHDQGFDDDVIEVALHHKIGGIRGVYNRAKYANQRKQMLQAWADYVSSLIARNTLDF